MVISGYTTRAIYGYKPVTIPALSWVKKANGFWASRDFGSSQDRYESEIEIQDTYSNLKALVAELKSNRGSITLSLGVGEEIFGADVVTTSCTVKEFDLFKRDGFTVYSLGLRLRSIAPTFTGSADFTVLHPQDQYVSDTFVSMLKPDSYTGAFTYIDPAVDTGVFRVQFKQTTAEMKSIRRYLMTEVRGGPVTVPRFNGITDLATGETFAYGPSLASGPFRARVVNWRELGRRNFQEWFLEIEFLQDHPYFPARSGVRSLPSDWTSLSAGNGPRDTSGFKFGKGLR